MLAVAKCGGPQIEFQPGRVDAEVPDAPMRLPNPVAPLAHTVGWPQGNLKQGPRCQPSASL
jgi:hypothetical protein